MIQIHCLAKKYKKVSPLTVVFQTSKNFFKFSWWRGN